MKIALFHEVQSGGARRGANEFAKAFRLLGHTVDLYIVDEAVLESEKKYYDSVYLYPFLPKKWIGKNWKVKFYKDTVELYKLYMLHKGIAADMQNRGYDFVFIHPSRYTQAPFVLRFLSMLKVYYCQEPLRMIYEKEFDTTESLDFFRKRYERITRRIRKEIDRKNISCSDIILANSSFTQKNIANAYGLFCTVCHMGVDTTKFFPAKVKKDIDILYIGSKDSADGYEIFQKAREKMQYPAEIAYLIRGENWLNNDAALRAYYSRAKIVICFGEKEPFGLIPLEVMACASMPFAFDEGGYKDSIIHGKTGILIKKDSAVIAQKLDDVLHDQKVLLEYWKNAQVEIEKKWHWSQSAEKVLSTVKEWKKTTSRD